MPDCGLARMTDCSDDVRDWTWEMLTRPTAKVTTTGGTEWFLTLTDQGWRLSYLQTW